MKNKNTLEIDRNSTFTILLMGLYFGFLYVIAYAWYHKGYFAIENVFFDSDTDSNLRTMAHGYGRRAITHSLLEIFSIPIRAISATLSHFHYVTDKLKFREVLALSISPFFMTLTVFCYFNILKLLRVSRIDVIIFTSIFAFSFSNLLFAIIPETYAISGCLISWLIYYVLLCKQNNDAGKPYIWFALAFLLAGITITNICIFFLIYLLHQKKTLKQHDLEAFIVSARMSVLAFVLVIAIYKIANMLLSGPVSYEGSVDWISKYLVLSLGDGVRHVTHLFSASMNVFVVTPPVLTLNKPPNDFNQLSLMNNSFAYLWLTISIGIIFLIRSVYKHRKNEQYTFIYMISLSVIAYNFALHAIFGKEMFLYTQHWMLFLSLMMLPILRNKYVISIPLLAVLFSFNLHFLLNIDDLIVHKPEQTQLSVSH